MAIDVEAVCAEWRLLGGTIDRSGKSPILNGDAEDDGYDKAAALAYKAFKSKKSIRQVAREERVLPEQELERLLDPRDMLGSV